MFLCKFFLYRFILVFASNNLASQRLVLRGNASRASKTLSQNLCHLYRFILYRFILYLCHLLYRFILVFASNNLASQSLVLRGNASRASKTLSQNLCRLCPPYLPTMWYFLPFQVNTSCATFKQFKSYYLLFVSMFYSS